MIFRLFSRLAVTTGLLLVPLALWDLWGERTWIPYRSLPFRALSIPYVLLPLTLLSASLWTAAAVRWGRERTAQGFPARRIRLLAWPPLLLSAGLIALTLWVLAPRERTFVARLRLPTGLEQFVIVRTGPQSSIPPVKVWVLERTGLLSWRTVLSDTVEEGAARSASDIVRLQDLNGDGFPELLVAICWGSGGTSYVPWHHGGDGRWTRAAESLANPTWCPAQRCVLEWSRRGCGNFDAARWVWEGDRLACVETVSQSSLHGEGKDAYRLKVHRRQGDDLALVKEWESPTPHAWAVWEGDSWEPPDGLRTLASTNGELKP